MSDGIVSRALGMVARFVTTLIDDAPRMQSVQGIPGDADSVDDAEHFQPYGFTAVAMPPDTDGKGPEAIMLAPGGDRSQVVVICVADRRFRLRPLADGEVALYDDLGSKVHLTRTGIVIDSTSILLGTGATKAVARVGDSAAVDSSFATWIGAVSTFTGVTPPAANTSSIVTGSSVVKAVD